MRISRLAKGELCATIVALFFVPLFVFAQTDRSYSYSSVVDDIVVEKDASIRVSEHLAYDFYGTYHLGYRSILNNGTAGITDISVSDETTGKTFSYTNTRLDKTDPISWGRFTTYQSAGATIVEWYYDLGDAPHTEHTWVVRYIVHGAVAFHTGHDELYWNLFTDFDVPVRHVEAFIHLPADIVSAGGTMYLGTPAEYVADMSDSKTFHFTTQNILPHEAVTIAVGWQKGLVSKGAFFRDWIVLNSFYAFSLSLILLSIIISLLHWFFTEYFHKGRGTIIPEYEPPRNLPPAMAQLIATEKSGMTTWPATLVDLAVRGYVKILKEKRPSPYGAFWGGLFASEGYRVDKLKDFVADVSLKKYEKEFLGILFGTGPLDTTFSTIDLQKSLNSSRGMALAFRDKMQSLQKTLYAETTEDTKAYDVPLTVMNWSTGAMNFKSLMWIPYIVFLFGFMFSEITNPVVDTHYVVLGIAVALSFAILFIYIKLNPRLNAAGFLLRDDWRGFKLYLETAEKYRLQNLTPDLFEKYLPYAMIFGIEKKWSKAFDGMNLKQPQWYGATGYVGSSSGISSGAFSASAFSASFSSSFTSAFASSGAGGASGGGGGAGGGGGGGGGGAS